MVRGAAAVSAALATHVTGEGSALVLVHGWGMHSGIWGEVVPALAPRHRVVRVDLPGHGASLGDAEFDLPALREALVAAVPEPAVWVGWSLGGLAVLDLALHQPQQVRGLVLVAATPRFVRGSDWPHAVAPEILEQFAAGLEDSYDATLLRFLALQTRGAADGREALRRLRESWRASPAPRPMALRSGLALLRDSDLRSQLAGLHCPVLVVGGERDTLVPSAALTALVAALPDARMELIAGAGHAPFISAPETFVQQLTAFASSVSAPRTERRQLP